MEAELEEIKDYIYSLIKDSAGIKRLKPLDLQKFCKEKFPNNTDKNTLVKEAIKQLVEEEKIVYTYYGGTFLELPHKEASAND